MKKSLFWILSLTLVIFASNTSPVSAQYWPITWEEFNQNRTQAWSTSYDGWEVLYDGVDSPADNVPNHLKWDNPVDDDWNLADLMFQFNTPEVGFLTVDRATNPANHIKTGNIWRRDEWLSFTTGVTIELRVKIQPNSTPFAYSINEVHNAGSFGVHLSTSSIKVGSVYQTASGTLAGFNTSNDFHIYRIVRPPNNHIVKVYVDNNTTPLVQGQGATYPDVGDTNYDYPYILTGDNSNNTSLNAHYILDYVKYRRGEFPPGSTLTAIPARNPPVLPSPAPSNEPITLGFDGRTSPANIGLVTLTGPASTWSVIDTDIGLLDFDTNRGFSGAMVQNVPGLTHTGSFMIETRLKVMPDSQERGFTVNHYDGLGASSLTFSTNKVELFLGLKPVGFIPINLDATQFHTYRLVRQAQKPYVNLYIDGHPVPAIADYHLDGSQAMGTEPTRLWFGYIGLPYKPPQTLPRGHVVIDMLRVGSNAYAPPITNSPSPSPNSSPSPSPNPYDLNNDTVVDSRDIFELISHYLETDFLLGDYLADNKINLLDISIHLAQIY